VIAASLAAPVVPAVAFTAGLMLSFHNGFWGIVGFPLCYVVALLAEALLGAPLFLLAWRFRMVTWWASAVAGAAVGVAALTILQSFRLSDLRGPMAMGGLGAAAGLVFWLVARLGRDPAPADSLTTPPT
jgi:hypothetical protein